MKIKVIASTKVGYVLPKEEAVDFSGKSAADTTSHLSNIRKH